jgi:hypothetical protein
MTTLDFQRSDKASVIAIPPLTVLPAMPTGKSNDHIAHPAALTLSVETLIRLRTEIGDSVARDLRLRCNMLVNRHIHEPSNPARIFVVSPRGCAALGVSAVNAVSASDTPIKGLPIMLGDPKLVQSVLGGDEHAIRTFSDSERIECVSAMGLLHDWLEHMYVLFKRKLQIYFAACTTKTPESKRVTTALAQTLASESGCIGITKHRSRGWGVLSHQCLSRQRYMLTTSTNASRCRSEKCPRGC